LIFLKKLNNHHMKPLEALMKIKKHEKYFIRDRWGNLTDCYWNEMTKQEILKLEQIYSASRYEK